MNELPSTVEYKSSGLTLSCQLDNGVWACTHELGHLLGARHDNALYNGCPSIMHPAPLPFVGACPLAFSDRSKNQILACNFRR